MELLYTLSHIKSSQISKIIKIKASLYTPMQLVLLIKSSYPKGVKNSKSVEIKPVFEFY